MQEEPPGRAKPLLLVCHGDEGGPRMHPCRRLRHHSRAILSWVKQQS
jgi:hypothetical protein